MRHTVHEIGLSSIQLNLFDCQKRIERNSEQTDRQRDQSQCQGEPRALPGQHDDQNGHQGNIDGHQQDAAPDGQAEIDGVSAKVGHGKVHYNQIHGQFTGMVPSK